VSFTFPALPSRKHRAEKPDHFGRTDMDTVSVTDQLRAVPETVMRPLSTDPGTQPMAARHAGPETQPFRPDFAEKALRARPFVPVPPEPDPATVTVPDASAPAPAAEALAGDIALTERAVIGDSLPYPEFPPAPAEAPGTAVVLAADPGWRKRAQAAHDECASMAEAAHGVIAASTATAQRHARETIGEAWRQIQAMAGNGQAAA
jgi:hypothetical protein